MSVAIKPLAGRASDVAAWPGGRGWTRLLAVGTDADLARPSSQAGGDAHQRQLAYASVLADYQMVVRTLGGRSCRIEAGPGFIVHASGSCTRLSFPLDAVRVGLETHRRHGMHLVSTEDPMLCGLAGAAIHHRAGLPLSVQLAGDMLDNPHWLADRRANPLLNAIGRRLVLAADSVRVVSTSEREKLIRMGVRPERVWNLGWLFDPSPYLAADGAELRAALLRPGFQRLVLFVGRLVLQKDLSTLVRSAVLACREQPEARFVVVGGGPERAAAEALATAAGLGEALLFTGPIPHAQLPAYYAAADIFVLPSRYEGNARVLAEAGAAGLPVVTTDVSGARDTVLDGETGFVLPIGDPMAFAGRVCKLLADRQRAAEMGALARQRVSMLYSAARLLPAFRRFWECTALRSFSLEDADAWHAVSTTA
ncbi:MAG: glycosyltransferase [Chloroflexi bacterium]|nr:glycosyltransferase [Chloroflexota bacterium]